MLQLTRHQLGLILAAGLVFFTNLGVPDLWDEDEPKNAACTREMLERGDWVVPMFNYELRTHKPVLMYWFMMTAYTLFGVNEFSARFWSAVLGTGTVLLTYQIGRKLFRPETGWWAGMMLAAALMFGVSSRAATPDAPLIFFCTLALAIFVWGADWTTEPTTGTPLERVKSILPTSWKTYAALFGAMGFAVLAKGPVGLLLPTMILCLYAFFVHAVYLSRPEPGAVELNFLQRCGRAIHPWTILRLGWMLRPMTALLMVLTVALPWYVWVTLRTEGAWLQGFIGQHNVGRFMTPMEGHGGPPYYYIFAVLIGFFPWSIFLPLSVIQWSSRLRNTVTWNRGDLFAGCWAFGFIIFFSLARTKLPSYVLPAYPALALLTARCVETWLAHPTAVPKWLMRVAFAVLVIVGIGLMVAVPIAASELLPGQGVLGWVGLIPCVGGLVCWFLLEQNRQARAANWFGVMGIAFAMMLLGVASTRVDRFQTSSPLMSLIHRSGEGHPEIGSFRMFQPSLAFYAKQQVHRLGTDAHAVAFLEKSPSAYIVTRREHYEEIRSQLPDGVTAVGRWPMFLKDGEIVVVGRPHGEIIDATAARAADAGTVRR